MLFSRSKKYFIIVIFAVITVLSVFVSCQKELSGEGIIIDETPTDLTGKIASSVSGFVTDENDVPVQGAVVQFGQSSATTDQFGYFRINSAAVTQNAAAVTVLKPGYFKCIKTYLAKPGKSAFFRIKLLPKNIEGNIAAATGGTVALSNGLSISLPANALVNAATNVVYSGRVNVAAHWMNPTASDLHRIMPGDLRGLDSLGFIKTQTTFGMAVIELTGSSGELLQITPGKKATLNFPIPSSLVSSAPAVIPLWYFDETIGLWKQEGAAIKTGNNYTGEISHFSFWNCGVPADNLVQFDATFVDAAGKPIPNASVWTRYANSVGWSAHGYTDSGGYVNGVMPANAQIIMEVVSDNVCSRAAYSKQFATGKADISLGNISITANTIAAINGSVINCNNTAASNGFVILKNGVYNYRAEVNADGTFSFNTVLCNGNADEVQFIAIDNAGLQQSNTLSYTLVNGINAVNTLNTCGVISEEFINYSINGVNYSITPPVDSMINYFLPRTSTPAMQIFAINRHAALPDSVNIFFSQPGIAAGSTQLLFGFYISSLNEPNGGISINTPVDVNITEFGAMGEFIAGNFSGVLTGPPPANKTYNIVCSFRVRRNG